MLLSQNATFTNPTIASATIIGLIAWGLAIGATELQRKANRTEEKIDTALNMPKGSSRAELETAVKENQ